MAVYTRVDDAALAAFLAEYDIGALRSAKGIAEGVENTNYVVGTTAGTFILTLYEQRVDARDLPFFLSLMDHLAGNGVVVPRPIHRRDGTASACLCGRPAALFTFLDGVAVMRPDPFHCAALGRALAALHTAAQGFALVRPNALGPAAWRPLFDDSRAEADTVAPGLAALIDAELDAIDAAWPSDLPHGVIHADLFPDNAFFIGKDLSGIIDFYFACNDLTAYDLAVCLNAWCFEPDGSYNITKARALTAAYTAVRPLSRPEADALAMLCRGAALRFLLTRLHDWLRVPAGALVVPKDPRPYAARLRFHRTVVSASEYGL